MSVGTFLSVTGLLVTPTAVVGAVFHGPRIARAAYCVAMRHRQRAGEPPVLPEPIEETARTLRRLIAEHDALRRNSGAAFRVHHLSALEAAIGDCALAAARALDVPAPAVSATGTLSQADLGALLRSLAVAGLVVPTRSELLLAGLSR